MSRKGGLKRNSLSIGGSARDEQCACFKLGHLTRRLEYEIVFVESDDGVRSCYKYRSQYEVKRQRMHTNPIRGKLSRAEEKERRSKDIDWETHFTDKITGYMKTAINSRKSLVARVAKATDNP